MSLRSVPLLLVLTVAARTAGGAGLQEPGPGLPDAPVEALSPAPQGTVAGQLERARSTFLAADRDGDGGLDARELRAAGIPGLAGASHDVDADGRLVLDEFLVYYRRLLLNARRSVEPELEAAVRAVLAERERLAERQREAERTRERERAELRRRRGVAALDVPGEEPPRWVLLRSRQRLDEVQAELTARPQRPRRGAVAPEGAPLAAAAEGLVGEARELRAAAGGLLEGRAERLAVLRRRLDGVADGVAPEVAEELEAAPAQGAPAPARPVRSPAPGAKPAGRPGAPVAGGPDRAQAERAERAADAATPAVRTAGPRVDAVGGDEP